MAKSAVARAPSAFGTRGSSAGSQAGAAGSQAGAPARSARSPNMGIPPPTNVSPFKEIGGSGVAVFGGQVLNREKDYRVVGQQKWITFSELMTNTSIVAAGIRYFLNVIGSASWTLAPAVQEGLDQATPEAEDIAAFVESVMNDMETPWRRVMRRAAMYRFNGYGIQEWTAKKREKDGKIGLEDVEARPCHTMERWEVDEKGTVIGIWQRLVQTGEVVFLPRQKILYLVEDSLTDNPEGLGLFRHMVDPYERLRKFQSLEGVGFERDLRGIPIGRVPYQAIRDAVEKGKIDEGKANRMISAIEDFVKMQSKKEDTSIVLDSAPYATETNTGTTLSGVMQFGIELLQGQTPGFSELNEALSRLNMEIARIIGVEHLLLGGAGSANRALSEDKSRNFYLTCNATLDEIADGADDDIINNICDLNGIPDELRPKLQHSDVSFRAISEITGALAQMATAGAVLSPDDPAINEIRDMLGLPKQPEMSPEMMGALERQKMGLPPIDPMDPTGMGMGMEAGMPPGAEGMPPGAKPGEPGAMKPGAEAGPSPDQMKPGAPDADGEPMDAKTAAQGRKLLEHQALERQKLEELGDEATPEEREELLARQKQEREALGLPGEPDVEFTEEGKEVIPPDEETGKPPPYGQKFEDEEELVGEEEEDEEQEEGFPPKPGAGSPFAAKPMAGMPPKKKVSPFAAKKPSPFPPKKKRPSPFGRK